VAVVLVDDDEMAELNRRYRNRPGPTDVLSFTYLAPDGDGECALAAGVGRAFRDLWLATPSEPAESRWEVVGEIVLAPAYVTERCGRHGWDTTLEWALLTVHGSLHLMGWEHATAAGRRSMRAAEVELLALRGLDHPLRHEPTED
jgi:probable rRNA maturation factor